MPEKINGYQLNAPLTNVKAGFCKWGFAKKGSKEYFIKEFLKPKYPMDKKLLSPEKFNQMVENCKAFFRKKREFYNILNECETGNIVLIVDFFRHESRYYTVTEKIDVSTTSIEDISKLSIEKKMIIIRVLTHSVRALHEKGIVHSDLKPNNILVKNTSKGYYTVKLIDFDSSFLEKDAPKVGEELTGDMVYFAPEALRHTSGENVKITTKIDVFALGILFHEYFTGHLPEFDNSKNAYISGAILNGDDVKLSNRLPENMRLLIRWMLKKDPYERPNLKEVFNQLKADMSLTNRTSSRSPIRNTISGSGRSVADTSGGSKTTADEPRGGSFATGSPRSKSGGSTASDTPPSISFTKKCRTCFKVYKIGKECFCAMKAKIPSVPIKPPSPRKPPPPSPGSSFFKPAGDMDL